MAVKVRGLPGASLAPDEPGTQDFLMVNSAVFPFANVADYLALTQAQRDKNDKIEEVLDTFGKALAMSGRLSAPRRPAPSANRFRGSP